MVFLVGTPAYIGSMTLICSPTPGQFFTPTNHHPAFTISERFLGMVGGANIAHQRKITLQAPTAGTLHMQLQGKHSGIF